MQFVYNFFIPLFKLALYVKAWFNNDVKVWNQNRSIHFDELENIKLRAKNRRIIWMHCASLGEYEQGIPVFKNLRKEYQDSFFIISFFSPSGYEQRKNSTEADEIIYLPIDTKSNARKMVSTLKPYLFIGVKYEFWWNLIKELQLNKVKTIYLSVYIEKEKYFLKFKYFKTILQKLDYIFTQDEGTHKLLQQNGFTNSIASLDTRVISVIERKERENKLAANTFLKSISKPIIVYGSIYNSDLLIIKSSLKDDNFFHIVVPHKVERDHIEKLSREINCDNYWSRLDSSSERNIIIVDIIGILFDLYRYASFAYVGGGFEKGVHNTLEPAVQNIPIIFGPKNDGFLEVKDFMELGVANEVNHEKEFKSFVVSLEDPKTRKELAFKLTQYFNSKVHCYSQLIKHIKSRK